MKKFLTFACVLVLGVSLCLAGCNLISRNENAYFSRVVAKAGDIEVSYEELYEMCSYVKQYNDLSSLTEEQVKKVCEDLLNKKLYFDYCTRDESVLLTEQEKNYLYSQVYEAINNTIYQYEQQIMYGYVVSQTRSSEPSKVYKIYDAPLTYSLEGGFAVNSNFKLLDTLDAKPEFEFVSTATASVQSQARIDYFNSLRETAKLFGKTDLSNAALLQGEIERIYKNYYESALILKINFEYIKQNSLTENTAVSLFNDEIFDEYKELVETEKENLDDKKLTTTSIGNITISDVEGLNAYCPSIITENFIKVAHIVINDEKTADKDKTINEIYLELDAIFESIDSCASTASVDELLADMEIEAAFVGENTLANKKLFAKESVFRTYIYKYSDDSFTSKIEYVLNKDVNSSLNSTFDINFKEAAVGLYAEGAGEAGTLSAVISSHESTKTYSGKHILLYLGQVQKLENENSIILDENHETTSEEKAAFMQKIATSPISFGHNKTVYNMLCENILGGMKLFEEKYNSYLDARVAEITASGSKVEYYTNKMKDLWA